MTAHLSPHELTPEQRCAEVARLLAKAVLRRIEQDRRMGDAGSGKAGKVAHSGDDRLEVPNRLGLHVAPGPTGERRGAREEGAMR